MNLNLTINNQPLILESPANETLLRALRRHGKCGVKHGCENRNSKWRNVYTF